MESFQKGIKFNRMGPVLSIQYLRALAALAVAMAHCWEGSLVLQAGVDVFFIISGFIMWTLTAKPVGITIFWWHRLARVAPLYWMATILMALHQHAHLHDVAASMAFWPYFGSDGHIWPVIVPGWTTNYEMAFYGLIGLTLLVSRRTALLSITATLFGLATLHNVVGHASAPMLTYTNPIMLEFLAGIGLAELRLRRLLPHPLVGGALCLAGLGWFWGTSPAVLPEGWERCLLWGLPALALVGGAVTVETRAGMVRIGWLLLLGDASYSIYLTHTFVLQTVLRGLVHAPDTIRVIAAMAVTVVAGLAVHFVIERPVILFTRHLGVRFAKSAQRRAKLAMVVGEAAMAVGEAD